MRIKVHSEQVFDYPDNDNLSTYYIIDAKGQEAKTETKPEAERSGARPYIKKTGKTSNKPWKWRWWNDWSRW